jgi:hypothetical protein
VGAGFGSIKLSDQFREAFRHALPHNIVIHRTKLMADPGLDLGVQAALLAGCGILGLYIFHDLIHASPRVKSLKFQELILDPQDL